MKNYIVKTSAQKSISIHVENDFILKLHRNFFYVSSEYMFTVYCDFNKKYDKNPDTLFKGRVYLKLHAKIGMELDRMIQQ